MWRTCEGERVLRGAEWELFRAGLVEVWDLVEDSLNGDDWFLSGIAAFDKLQPEQKLALLAQVGQALHDESVPPPALTAHTEGAAAAVYEHIRQSIQVEIDNQDESERAGHFTFWRRLVLSAYREWEDPGDEPLPDEECNDLSEWDLLLHCLTERIFWDDDYVAGDHFLDAEPEAGRAEMRKLGIAEDYFVMPAPDPNEAELETARDTLRRIAGRPEAKEDKLLQGFEDCFHGLLVGPCDAETLGSEAACRLVQAMWTDSFDCSYSEWRDHFREAVLQAASFPEPDHVDPAAILTPEQLALAEQAKRSGSALDLGSGHRAELRRGGWVVSGAQPTRLCRRLHNPPSRTCCASDH